jgi:transposase
MIPKEVRQTILSLHEKGKSNRVISRLLKVSRNTVRKVLKEGAEIVPMVKENYLQDLLPVVREVYLRCQGNAVRVKEILKEEYDIDIAYSTLTRLIQNAELREPMKRVGEYIFAPGQEMQHDTSPHWVPVGDKKIKAQCASLIFGFSRRLFMQYYPCFTRFEAKSFLKAALEFMQGSCHRCVIDNTSVILAAGSGANAVVAPEMGTFSRMFGFEFIAHCISHADRKGKIERPFYYIETNFLAGRVFKDWDDLNQQAKQWCIEYANKKEKRVLGTSAEIAFLQEKPYLTPLPEVLPLIYEHYQRIVDPAAYINLDTNRYSVPEKLIGKTLDVYKYPEEIRIFHRHQEVAVHRRLAEKRYGRSTLKGHHTRHYTQEANSTLKRMEDALSGYDEILDTYVAELKKQVRGRGIRQLNRLLSFKHTYPAEAFINAIKQAHHYGLYDLNRIEELIIKYVAGNYFNLNEEDV